MTFSQDEPAPLSPEYPYETTTNPGIPTLQEITAGATTDNEALQMVVDYYYTHEDWLRQTLQEDDPTRLISLYVMFVTHISQIYGEAKLPPTFLDYLKERYSHCANYSIYQADILNSFGLTWRIFFDAAAEHEWIEAKLDDHWEVFDATVNVWIDQNGFDLLKGLSRSYRNFYSPMNDVNRPDAREHYWKGPSSNHLVGWYNMPRLRMWMPGLGLYYNPPTRPEQVYIFASSPGEGGLTTTPWILSTLPSS